MYFGGIIGKFLNVVYMGEIEVQVCSLCVTGMVREAASVPGAAELRVCLLVSSL